MSEPIIDLHSDDYFMGEALRQAAKAYEAEEVPVGAVVVREGQIIARAFNQVETLKDATAHAEMLALTQAESARRLAADGLHALRHQGAVPDVRRRHRPYTAGARGFWGGRSKGGAAGSALNLLQFPTLNHRCEITAGVRAEECRALLRDFFSPASGRRPKGGKNGAAS